MLVASISFFNELSTEKRNYSRCSGFNPHIYVSFFNDLSIERKTLRGFFPDLSQQTKNSLRKGSTPPKGCTNHFNAPPKKAMEHRHSLTVGRGVLPSKNPFFSGKSLLLLVK
jgi:hypothetical protein